MSLKSLIKLIVYYYLVFFAIKGLLLITEPKTSLSLTFFDVGEGDSIFIKYRNPRTAQITTILIDGGANFDTSFHLNNLFLMPFCKIDYVFITHPDQDHLFGINRLIENCQINYLTFNDIDFGSSLYAQFQENILTNSTSTKSAQTINHVIPKITLGNKLVVGDLKLFVLWPDEDTLASYKEINQISTILLLSYKEFSVLFTGDAESSIMERLDAAALTRYAPTGLDVLKVPHHGSKTGLTREVLDLLKPKNCVISVGENRFGHPSPALLSLLKNENCHILRTDELGSIEFRIN